MMSTHGHSLFVHVDEPTKVGEARRTAVALAETLGFDDVHQGKVALIATEAASNLIKHGGGGDLILTDNDDGTRVALEILAVDSGHGMSDVSRCLVDGFSSAGSPGTGLGAISRLADLFDVYSTVGAGTVVWARLYAKPPPASTEPSRPTLDVGAVRVAVAGETVCGDNWASVARDGSAFLMVADGLGHGRMAAVAADEAVRVFLRHRSREPQVILESIHEALRGTRGAAIAIARFDFELGVVRYAGIGNIGGVIAHPHDRKSTNLVSQNGTVGFMFRRIHTFEYEWTDDCVLLMFSDGLATHWSLEKYPGLHQRNPTVIAGVLYRDHKRKRDDVTVVATRRQKGNRP